MKKITEEELKTILEQHELWLNSNGKEGKCADLRCADLTDADLSDANLRCANLYGAYLTWANLTDADLTGADLRRAYLIGAYLIGADLSGADLTDAILTCADLTRADLSDADLTDAILTCADLTRADLSDADLIGSELEYSNLTDTILDEKEQCRKGVMLTEPMTGYKKSNEGKIITLKIPIGAKVFSINNNRRRTNKCKVIDMQGKPELRSKYDASFKYHVGDEIDIIDFNDNYNVECGEGIHFFLTIDEAENFKI